MIRGDNMSVSRKCDFCGKEFGFGFSVDVSLQGGLDFLNIAKYRFDIGKQDICEDCFYKMKNMSKSLRDKNRKEMI